MRKVLPTAILTGLVLTEIAEASCSTIERWRNKMKHETWLINGYIKFIEWLHSLLATWKSLNGHYEMSCKSLSDHALLWCACIPWNGKYGRHEGNCKWLLFWTAWMIHIMVFQWLSCQANRVISGQHIMVFQWLSCQVNRGSLFCSHFPFWVYWMTMKMLVLYPLIKSNWSFSYKLIGVLWLKNKQTKSRWVISSLKTRQSSIKKLSKKRTDDLYVLLIYPSIYYIYLKNAKKVRFFRKISWFDKSHLIMVRSEYQVYLYIIFKMGNCFVRGGFQAKLLDLLFSKQFFRTFLQTCIYALCKTFLFFATKDWYEKLAQYYDLFSYQSWINAAWPLATRKQLARMRPTDESPVIVCPNSESATQSNIAYVSKKWGNQITCNMWVHMALPPCHYINTSMFLNSIKNMEVNENENH